MKRSEMVRLIKDAINAWNGAYYDTSLEEHILDVVEEAGMLPPNTYLTNELDNTWEPESV